MKRTKKVEPRPPKPVEVETRTYVPPTFKVGDAVRIYVFGHEAKVDGVVAELRPKNKILVDALGKSHLRSALLVDPIPPTVPSQE